MTDIAPQASFNSGEWAPSLYARVDMTKYRSGAALLENYFVDYRGGASSRPGTKYVIQAFKSSLDVRLIPFQATSTVGYILEFGHGYIRFIFNGQPIVENAFAITGATRANPCVLTIPGNNYIVTDWIFVQGVNGMTQLNGRYFIVAAVSGSSVTLHDLRGFPVDSTTYGAYISGGTAARIYTLPTSYLGTDLAKLKFAQSVNQMIICHPSYPPVALSEISSANWTINPIVIGSTASAPVIAFFNSSLAAGAANYAYVATSIDGDGQESTPSPVFNYLNLQDMRIVAGSIELAWNAVSGAVAYNVYKADISYIGVVPAGATFGFIGQTTGVAFIDTNIGPDYTQTPPIAENPFQGAGVSAITMTNQGTYTTVPTASVIGAATIIASIAPVLEVTTTPTVGSPGVSYAIGDTVLFSNNVVLVVASLTGSGVASWAPLSTAGSSVGAVTSGSVPANPVTQISSSGAGIGATANLTWGVGFVQILNSGAGYTSTPTISFSAGSAAAVATLSPTSNGYPSVPSFFQQRLILAAPTGAPQTFYGSKTGAYYNFNQSNPPKSTDAIEATLVSGVLNTIKSIVSSTAGMLILSDKASWLVNGGTSGAAVTPSAINAAPQSFNGSNDVPPIVANYDVLYVQEKGSSIRDLAYNIYFNVFTGTDISIIASHLFFGFQILEWAWAEEPFKVVWAVRNDGVMLTLTFLKEQDFIGWAHQVTSGNFKSVAVVTEATEVGTGFVDAVYTVVQRTVQGETVQYIERVAERIFPNGAVDAWCVDAGLQYVGAPASTFTGGEHLGGLTVTGLADGIPITPFVMPFNGIFTLPAPASKVTIGLGYVCDLQTLALDIGEPSAQGKVKKIPHVDVRVNQTLGLEIGPDFTQLTPMKDLVIGNVSSMLTGQPSQVVTGLVSGDARTFLMNSAYTIPGQYCIRQSLPLPASILGVFPSVVIGDDR